MVYFLGFLIFAIFHDSNVMQLFLRIVIKLVDFQNERCFNYVILVTIRQKQEVKLNESNFDNVDEIDTSVDPDKRIKYFL